MGPCAGVKAQLEAERLMSIKAWAHASGGCPTEAPDALDALGTVQEATGSRLPVVRAARELGGGGGHRGPKEHGGGGTPVT